MKRLLLMLVVGSLAIGSLDACVVRARPAAVYEVGPGPRAGHVWIPAHWAGRVWIRGHWRVA